jgi:hypothetical protein
MRDSFTPYENGDRKDRRLMSILLDHKVELA